MHDPQSGREPRMPADPLSARPRNWVWYFVALTLVAAVLLLWLALFIQEQLKPGTQLSLEQLRTAREAWQRKGPKSYEMVYSVKRGGQSNVDSYFVVVRDGVVQSVVMNGKIPLEKAQFDYHSMPGLFKDIELFLQRDAQPGSPAVYCRGWFRADDGRLMHFVRRVVGGESVEIEVKEFKA